MKTCSSNSSNKSVSGNTKQKQIACSKNWCFTLNNWTNEQKDMILSVCSNSSNKYIFQSEVGESGTPHLQGYIEFKEKIRPLSLFSFKEIHWEKCRNVKASIAYCSKSDTSTGERWTNIKLPKPIKIIDNLYPWQLYIVSLIEKEADDRKIYWFWENEGGVGKSCFCKYLCVKYGAIVLSGKANDSKYGIVKYNEVNGVYPDIIIFDIPRSNLEYISYEALESIKNGLFFCGKYESTQVVMNSPHILCFANEEPKKEMLSSDRWKIKKIK